MYVALCVVNEIVALSISQIINSGVLEGLSEDEKKLQEVSIQSHNSFMSQDNYSMPYASIIQYNTVSLIFYSPQAKIKYYTNVSSSIV